MTGELGCERLAARRARELRGDERAPELETGRERFLYQPDALHDRQTAAPPRLAALEIADGGLQITSDARPPPRAGHRCQ